jgi:hypothetical protein
MLANEVIQLLHDAMWWDAIGIARIDSVELGFQHLGIGVLSHYLGKISDTLQESNSRNS